MTKEKYCVDCKHCTGIGSQLPKPACNRPTTEISLVTGKIINHYNLCHLERMSVHNSGFGMSDGCGYDARYFEQKEQQYFAEKKRIVE